MDDRFCRSRVKNMIAASLRGMHVLAGLAANVCNLPPRAISYVEEHYCPTFPGPRAVVHPPPPRGPHKGAFTSHLSSLPYTLPLGESLGIPPT